MSGLIPLERALNAILPGVLEAQLSDFDTVSEQISVDTGQSRDAVAQLVYETIAQVNDKLFPPLTQLEMVYTEGCNLACAYCFEKDMLGHRRMPLEIARKAIDLLMRYSRDADELHIAHFGGEPLVNFPAVRFTTEYAEDRAAKYGKSVSFNMTTNGTLITDEVAAYCAEHRIMAMVSLDGLQESNDRYRIDKRGRGTFERAFAGLKTLMRHQEWIGVKITVMPETCDSLVHDIQHLYDSGVNQFTIGYATGIPWSHDERSAYVRNMERLHAWYILHREGPLLITEFEEEDIGHSYFGCQAGRSSVSISVDGEISPCSKVLAMDKKNLLARLGDVTHGVYQINNRIELVGCKQLKATCNKAGIANEYQGGCFATNYQANGSLFEPNLDDHDFTIRLRNSCLGCSSK